MGRQGYSAEFRRKVLDLLAEGRSVASVAHDLDLTLRRAGQVRYPFSAFEERPPKDGGRGRIVQVDADSRT